MIYNNTYLPGVSHLLSHLRVCHGVPAECRLVRRQSRHPLTGRSSQRLGLAAAHHVARVADGVLQQPADGLAPLLAELQDGRRQAEQVVRGVPGNSLRAHQLAIATPTWPCLDSSTDDRAATPRSVSRNRRPWPARTKTGLATGGVGSPAAAAAAADVLGNSMICKNKSTRTRDGNQSAQTGVDL